MRQGSWGRLSRDSVCPCPWIFLDCVLQGRPTRVDHLGGHDGSGGRAVSADKAGSAEDGVGSGGRGLVLGQDGRGAQKLEVRAGHGQALQEGLCLLAEDEGVVTQVGSWRLLDPALQSMQAFGHSHPESQPCDIPPPPLKTMQNSTLKALPSRDLTMAVCEHISSKNCAIAVQHLAEYLCHQEGGRGHVHCYHVQPHASGINRHSMEVIAGVLQGGEIVLAKEGHAVALLGDGDDCAHKAGGVGGGLVVHGHGHGLGDLQQLAALPEHPPGESICGQRQLTIQHDVQQQGHWKGRTEMRLGIA